MSQLMGHTLGPSDDDTPTMFLQKKSLVLLMFNDAIQIEAMAAVASPVPTQQCVCAATNMHQHIYARTKRVK